LKTITVTEFHDALSAQGVEREDLAFICPMCKTVQSAADFIAAGAGANFDEVEKYLGYSCIGRFTGAACHWTFGGFFKMNKMEVVTEDGKRYPMFEPATYDQAQQHVKRLTS